MSGQQSQPPSSLTAQLRESSYLFILFYFYFFKSRFWLNPKPREAESSRRALSFIPAPFLAEKDAWIALCAALLG